MVEFDPVTHKYTVSGQRVPHVTGIIKPLEDYAGIPPSVLEYASERGRAVHLACELLDLDDLDESSLDPGIIGYVDAYRHFLAAAGPVWRGIERRVYSERWRYAGTLDRVGVLTKCKGAPEAVLDIKCVAALSPVTGLQTAAYEEADRADRRHKERARYALQLRADGTYRLRRYAEPTDLSVFLAQLTIHGWCLRHDRNQEIAA